MCLLQPSGAAVTMAEADDENQEPEPLYDAIVRAQQDSVEYQATRARIHRLQTGQEDADTAWKRTLRDHYQIHDDLIWYVRNEDMALVVPLELWPRVIYEHHDAPHAGHPGRDETLRSIQRYYHWPAMAKQIKTHVKHCLICASTKRGGALQPAAPQRPHPPTAPWRVISLDVMGPYPETRARNRFLLVATDIFTKWVELRAVPSTSGRAIPDFVESICHRWGYPESIITDNGPQFRSRSWERFLHRNHIAAYYTPIYHQRSNPVERRNQEVKKALRAHLINKPENTWDRYLNTIMFNLHSRCKSATGQTPSQLLLGAPLVQPGGWSHPQNQRPRDNDAAARRQRIRDARARQIIFQRRLFPEPREAPRRYQPGQQVLVRSFPGTHTVLGPTWEGPYPIIRIQGDGVYEVDRNGAQELVHIDDIRSAPGQGPEPQDDHDPFAQPPEDPAMPEDAPPDAAEPTSRQRPGDDESDTRTQTSPLPGPVNPPDDDEEPLINLDEPQPGPSGLRYTPVTMEDVEDTDSEDEGCNALGTPIIGLWP